MNVADTIKSTLSMCQVAKMYGFEPNRSGFISCPFHGGDDTPSLKIYTEPGRGFHCHACGAGSSVIDFVMKLLNLSFAQAVVRLNADFGLGLTNERPDRREIEQLRKEQKRQAEELTIYRHEYDSKCILHRLLWQIKLNYAPKTLEEPLNSFFADALHELEYLDYWFEQHPYK